MLIDRLDVFTVREPVSRRQYSLVKLTTRDGVAGWGECSPLTAGDVDSARSMTARQPVHRYEVLRTRMENHPAQAAVNMACLDAVGKMARAPVFQVLGGPTRNKVRALTDWSPAALKAGHRAFVVPLPEITFPNPRRQFLSQVRERLEALRREAGDSADFVLDGNNQLPPGEAQNVSAAIEGLHPLWFDEPCALTNLGAARKISEENVTPLGWGRHIRNLAEVQNLLREQMIDVVRLDLNRHGISSIRRAAALAEAYYVAVAPYHAGGPVGTAAAIHLAASLPNFFIQQLPFAQGEDAKMRAELTGGDLEQVRDGFLPLPAKAGLGVEINESTLRRNAA
ncbi:MAG: mandelate racemase/muconate lactonizing enzyme family protein [Bryobacteraceae bacterium]